MAKKLIGELSIPEKYTINQTIVSTSWDDIEGKPKFAKVAETGNYNDLNNKPEIPSIDGLATKEELNAKQDKLTAGNNITIVDNVISSTASGGGSGPENYLVGASVEGNNLSLIPNKGQLIKFTPVGNYNFSSTQTFSDEEKSVIQDAFNGKINISINRLSVIRMFSYPGDKWAFVVINTNGATENQVLIYVVSHDANQNVTSNSFSLLTSYYMIGASSQSTGNILTSDNYSDYTKWILADSVSDSNLANAKELFILWKYQFGGNQYIPQYYNFSTNLDDNSQGTFLNYIYQYFSIEYSNGSTSWTYNGSEIIPPSNISIQKIYYKT